MDQQPVQAQEPSGSVPQGGSALSGDNEYCVDALDVFAVPGSFDADDVSSQGSPTSHPPFRGVVVVDSDAAADPVLVVSQRNHRVSVWDRRLQKVELELPSEVAPQTWNTSNNSVADTESAGASALLYAHRSSLLWCGWYSGCVSVYSVAVTAATWRFPLLEKVRGHKGAVVAITLGGPEEQDVFSCGADLVVLHWSVSTRHVLRAVSLPCCARSIIGVGSTAFVGAVIACDDGCVRLWQQFAGGHESMVAWPPQKGPIQVLAGLTAVTVPSGDELNLSDTPIFPFLSGGDDGNVVLRAAALDPSGGEDAPPLTPLAHSSATWPLGKGAITCLCTLAASHAKQTAEAFSRTEWALAGCAGGVVCGLRVDIVRLRGSVVTAPQLTAVFSVAFNCPTNHFCGAEKGSRKAKAPVALTGVGPDKACVLFADGSFGWVLVNRSRPYRAQAPPSAFFSQARVPPPRRDLPAQKEKRTSTATAAPSPSRSEYNSRLKQLILAVRDSREELSRMCAAYESLLHMDHTHQLANASLAQRSDELRASVQLQTTHLEALHNKNATLDRRCEEYSVRCSKLEEQCAAARAALERGMSECRHTVNDVDSACREQSLKFAKEKMDLEAAHEATLRHYRQQLEEELRDVAREKESLRQLSRDAVAEVKRLTEECEMSEAAVRDRDRRIAEMAGARQRLQEDFSSALRNFTNGRRFLISTAAFVDHRERLHLDATFALREAMTAALLDNTHQVLRLSGENSALSADLQCAAAEIVSLREASRQKKLALEESSVKAQIQNSELQTLKEQLESHQRTSEALRLIRESRERLAAHNAQGSMQPTAARSPERGRLTSPHRAQKPDEVLLRSVVTAPCSADHSSGSTASVRLSPQRV